MFRHIQIHTRIAESFNYFRISIYRHHHQIDDLKIFHGNTPLAQTTRRENIVSHVFPLTHNILRITDPQTNHSFRNVIINKLEYASFEIDNTIKGF